MATEDGDVASAGGEIPPASSGAPVEWSVVFDRVDEVAKRTRKKKGNFRKVREAQAFIEWMETKGYTPDARPSEVELLNQWREQLGVKPTGKLNISQGLALSGAKLVLQEEDNMRNGRPLPPKPVEPEEDEQEGDEEEDEVEESEHIAPPEVRERKAPRAAAPQPQVIYAQPPMMMPPGYGYPQPPKSKAGRPPTNPNHPNFGLRPPAPTSRIIPQNLREKIRVYHRGVGGKREPVMEYTLADLGGASLETFIHDYVDPEFGDPGAPENVYDIYEVGAGGDDRGAPATITVRNREQQQANPNDPIAQTRNVLELLQDVRQMEDTRRESSQALLDEFKKKAVGGNDMNSMMMLMMMERFMGGGNGASNPEALVMKVMEKLQGSGVQPAAAPLAPPPPPPVGSSTLEKVMELMAATALKPPPQPKTLVEQMAELKMLKEVFAPAPTSSIPPELVSILAKMSEKLDRPRGGVEEALSHFDKIRSMVKELAPQVNAGGITGAIQGILTPELARAVGNTFATAIDKAKEGAGAVKPPAPPLPANVQPVPPVQATPSPQPDAVPPEVIKAVEMFKATKDTTKARDTLIELLRAMYEKMPQQAARLDPVLGEVLKSNFEPARKALKEILLSAQRPELDNPVFIDRTIAALISNFGGTAPKELLHEADVVEFPKAVHDIPSAAESEAKDKAEREARKATNGAIAEGAAPQPEQPQVQPSNIA